MGHTNALRLLALVLAAIPLAACGSDDGGEEGAAGAATGGQSAVGGGSGAGAGAGSGGTTASGGAGNDMGGSSNAGAGAGLVGKLIINELMPSNQGVIMDEGGGTADWIELYNASDEAISLGGLYISDKLDNLTKAQLSENLSVDAGGVLLLWADSDTEQGDLHLPFNLSAAGEAVVLSDADGQVIDSVEFGAAAANTSFARLPDGSGDFSWCSSSTPGELNGSGC